MRYPENISRRGLLLDGLAVTVLAGLYTASRVLPLGSSARAASPATVALSRHSESRDFFLEAPTAAQRAVAETRQAQTERTCRFLNVFGNPLISAKDSDITAYFFGFKDQAQGLNFYNSSTQYYDLLAQYLDLVRTFAKREVDMNLTFSITRDAVVLDKPEDKPLFGSTGYGNQGDLETAMLSKLTFPESAKRTNKLLVALVNPDTDLSQVLLPGTDGNPYPGFSNGIYSKFTTALITSVIFNLKYQNYGPTVIAHEALYHGLLGNQTHNDDRENPKPNPLSIGRSSIGYRELLLSLLFDIYDLRGNMCVNNRNFAPAAPQKLAP